MSLSLRAVDSFALAALFGIAAMACAPSKPTQSRESPELPVLSYRKIANIGGAAAKGPAAFGRIRGVATFGDSLLAVTDEATQKVEMFTTDGRFLRSLGGRGAGPGMFEAIRDIAFDSTAGLCIWDIQLTRITHLTADGRVLGTRSPSLAGFSQLRPNLVGFVSGCSAVFSDRGRRVSRRTGQQRMAVFDTTTYVFFDADSGTQHVVARRSNPQAWFITEGKDAFYQDVILGPRTRSVVVGKTLWVGRSDSLQWERVDMHGDTLPAVALSTRREIATDEDIERERERLKHDVRKQMTLLRTVISKADRGRVGAAYDRVVRVTPVSHVLPDYDAIVVGSDHTIWVRRTPHVSTDSAEWVLLGSRGKVLGDLELPAPATVVAGSSHLVVLKGRDALDAEFLEILCIDRDGVGQVARPGSCAE